MKVNIGRLFHRPMTWTSIGLLFIFINALGLVQNNNFWVTLSKIAYVVGVAGTLIYFFITIQQQKY